MVQLSAGARRLVLATAGIGSVLLVVWMTGVPAWTGSHVTAWFALAVGTAIAELFPISLPHGEETENFGLSDALWMTGLLLVPGDVLVIGVATGAVVGQALSRVALHKLAFNVGHYIIGLSVAALIMGLAPAQDVLEPRSWLVALAAMAAYFLINTGSVAAVISLSRSEPFTAVLRPSLTLDLLHWLGNMALGILGAVILTVQPLALPAILAPLGVSYIAYRGWVEARRERDEMQAIAATADAISEQGDLQQRLPSGDRADEVSRLTGTLNAMLDRLERSYERERQFLSETSHELRTPITLCRGHLELLEATGAAASAEGIRDTIRIIIDELDRMGRLVGDMSLLAQAEHPAFVRREPVELDRLLLEVGEKAQPLLDGRLEVRDHALMATALADRQRLTQALINLLLNAAVHTAKDSPVVLQMRSEPGFWRFEVADLGGGLQAGEEEAVFEPFRRGHALGPGTGLGLAIVRAIGRAHGGAAGVDNRPGVGATFWIRIPR